MRLAVDVPPTWLSALILLAIALAATAAGLVLRARSRLRPASGAAAADTLTPGELGIPALGERATLVQFSSAFCQPCRATRIVLDEVTGVVPGVVHVEVDAESHLDLVRRLGVMRTPTVLVLDARGSIVRRASGAPRKTDVLATLATVVAPASR
jgi:thiol-disulfide isomerase/thioredoxin